MAEWKPPSRSRPPRRPGTFPRGAGTIPEEEEGPLVTEGMQARRRDIERKKREWRREQETLREEAQEGWVRVWKTVVVLFFLLGAGYVYWRIQSVYHNRWPIGYAWAALAIGLLGGITWMLWFFNKKDI